MWTSLEKILIPDSFEEALSYSVPGSSVFFGGGTYLVAEKDPGIKQLIDINHLLEDSIQTEGSRLRIGAGAPLQRLIHSASSTESLKEIASCASWSCPSKNIRNQRTIGGEIARGRLTSEIYVYLVAVDAQLEVVSSGTKMQSLRDWDGSGIVKAIEINLEGLVGSALHRFALIPSAPAFVITAGVCREGRLDLTIGGVADRISFFSVDQDDLSDAKITEFGSQTVKHFHSDHTGSLEYKQTVIEVGLRRVRKDL